MVTVRCILHDPARMVDLTDIHMLTFHILLEGLGKRWRVCGSGLEYSIVGGMLRKLIDYIITDNCTAISVFLIEVSLTHPSRLNQDTRLFHPPRTSGNPIPSGFHVPPLCFRG